MKAILGQTCDRIDPSNGQYSSDGHSQLYGYGRLNAEAAVKHAKQAVGQQIAINKLLNEPIPDLGSVEGTIEVTEKTPVEKIAISVKVKHTWIGDLLITAVPPPNSGRRQIILHKRAGGRRNGIDMLYDPSNTPKLSEFVGKPCNGTWTVRVEDKAPRDTGTLVQIGVHLFLPPSSPSCVVDTARAPAAPRKKVSKKKKATARPRRAKAKR